MIMQGWVLSIGAVVILTTVAGFIIPEGKLGKYVKSVFSVIVLLVVVNPFLSFDANDFDSLFDAAEKNVVLQQDFIDYVFSKKTAALENETVKIIEETGVFAADVKIIHFTTENYVYSIKKVEINLKNAVIKTDKEHIDIIEEIEKKVSEYLSLDKSQINIEQ